MKAIEFSRTIAQAPLAPVYVVYGREDLLARHALEAIKQRVLGPAREGHAVTNLDGDDVLDAPSRVFDLLQTSDFFSPSGRHVVIVHAAGKFVAKHRRLIERFAGRTGILGVLVLRVQGPQEGTQTPSAHLARLGVVVDCRPPRASEALALAQRIAGQFGKRLSSEAATLLVEAAGGALGSVRQQIESLAAFLGDEPEITEEHVLNLVGTDFQRNVWDLLDALGRGAAPQALRILERLFRQEAAQGIGPKVVGALNHEVREIARAKALMDSGEPPGRVEAMMSGPRAVRRQRVRLAREVSWEALRTRVGALATADVMCKSSGVPPQAVLETFVLSWLRGEKAWSRREGTWWPSARKRG